MFAKKFLSIAALVFLGSQISNVSAESLSGCDTTSSSCGGITGICLHSDNKIYQSGSGCYENAQTDAISQATTFVFYDNAKVANLGEGGDPDPITDISKLRIVKCTFSESATCADAYGYVLIGNKYFNVSEKQLTLCSEVPVSKSVETDCVSADHYCLLDDGKIYGYTDSTTTCAINAPGVYVFEDTGSNAGATLKTLGTDTLTPANIMLYQCSKGSTNTLSCSRTYGYVYDSQATGGAKYYAVAADGSVTDVTDSIASNDCSAESKIGLLHDTNKLCLFGKGDSPISSAAIGTAGTYIMNNVAANIFTNGLGTLDGSSTQSIVIQATANIFSLVSDDYDYCIGDNNVITPTFKDFCNNPKDCTKKAECSSNICKRDGGNDSEAGCSIVIDGTSSNCVENGYYLTDAADSGTLVTDGINRYLFQCKETGGVDCAPVPEDGFKIGYYKYAQQRDKYIKCTGYGACTVVDVISNKANCQAGGITVGDVINDGAKDILCLDTAVGYSGIPLNANANYFTQGIAGSIFNTVTTKYVKVEVAEGETSSYSVVLSDLIEEDNNVPKYVYATDALKIYERNDDSKDTTICQIGNTIIEFKHEANDNDGSCNYYKKHVTHVNTA